MATVATCVTNPEAIERARRVTAAELYDIEARHPAVVERAEGSWLYDVEGSRILDVTAASGALLLGNCHPRIEAVIGEYGRTYGTMFPSTLSLPRIELAERLCERYPAGEKAVFCKTGSESTSTAVRLARAATGRDLILTSGYHGWHDWQQAYAQFGFDARHLTVGFGYNQTALERLLDEFADRVAAVIVSPEPAWIDAEGFRRMSAACVRHGVLFILDEVITALRYGPHGLNGTGDVPADLITVSKGLANGHSLAAVLGRRDVMDAYDDAGIAGTYTREVPPMAAALATLDLLEDGSVHEQAEFAGRSLMSGMRDVLAAAGIPAHISGRPLMFDVVLPSDELSSQIYRAAFEHGVWFDVDGTHMVTAAFGEAEVAHALYAFEQGVSSVGERFAGGELPQARKHAFVWEAFGGILRDDAALLARIEEAVEAIGRA